MLIIFLIVEVSDLDVCIFTILNGSVNVVQHLLDAATSTDNCVLTSHFVAACYALTTTQGHSYLSSLETSSGTKLTML